VERTDRGFVICPYYFDSGSDEPWGKEQMEVHANLFLPGRAAQVNPGTEPGIVIKTTPHNCRPPGFAIPVASLPCPAVGYHALTPRGNDMDRGCAQGPDYSDGTNFTSPKYLCGDWRPGPIKPPAPFSLDRVRQRMTDWAASARRHFWPSTGVLPAMAAGGINPLEMGFQLDVNNTTINGTITLPVGTLFDRFGEKADRLCRRSTRLICSARCRPRIWTGPTSICECLTTTTPTRSCIFST
jgi:hypothetical protein